MSILEGYRRRVLEVFMDRTSPATLLFAVLLDMFETMEFVDWDPTTISLEFESETSVPWSKVPAVNRDKVMMMSALHTTNQFFQDLTTFIATCNAFMDTPVNPEVFDPADMEEMSWAVLEVALNGFTEESFHPDIKAYVGVQAGMEGCEKLPPLLKWGDSPIKEERPEIIDGDMFAAQFQQNTSDNERIMQKCKEKEARLQESLRTFPFRNRDSQSASKPS